MIAQYTEELTKIVVMMGINLTYAALCIILGILAMLVGYKLFDKITPFDTAQLLEKNPLAVGIFNGALVLGIGICSGIIIGLSCN